MPPSSSSPVSSGGRANRRGRILERYVRELLTEEYERVTANRFFAMRSLNQPIFAEQVETGTSIYNKKRVVDFALYHPQRWPECLVIQCKWQTSSGSVDEKYPYEVENIAHAGFPTIIVLDGGGYSDGARQWLLAQRGKRNLVDVCSQGDISRMQAQGRI